ncbi:hypothetical protein [Paenarthrobacter nitroguajacolicus]|uniref:hypothetical protein n=1 Tax=Paenarthrobacter nitroguajacolicus TaxID=211146 RepID=UPI0028670E92|nr:hypothetical protein [Paenarthrobacter nitroguajacolicus]MDR6639024.1 hypothetical protein [Paenarthrobacter nitroguajacolicus]
MDETNAEPGMTSAMWRVGQTAVEMYFFVALRHRSKSVSYTPTGAQLLKVAVPTE